MWPERRQRVQRRGVAAVVVALLVSACGGGGGGRDLGDGAGEAADGRATTSSTTAPADASNSVTSSGIARATTTTAYARPVTAQTGPRRNVVFTLRRDDALLNGGTMSYDGVQQIGDDGVTMTWTPRGNPAESPRTLRRAGAAWSGALLPDWALEWKECPWAPAPVYLPELRAGSRSELATECEHRAGDGRSHIRMTGTVSVTGTRDVRIDGKPFTTWIVERRWHTVITGDGSGEADFETTSLWSPDLQMIVKQDAHSWTPPDPNVDDTNLRTQFVLVGLEA